MPHPTSPRRNFRPRFPRISPHARTVHARPAYALTSTIALALLPLGALATAFLAPRAPRAPQVSPFDGTMEPTLSYNRDIRPILVENCFACHGPDSAARKAGLRLDRFADATARREDGKSAIVAGDVVNSELVRRLLLPQNDARHMPPPSMHKSLTPEEMRKVLLWIDQGARYEPHWSYIAPKRAPLPPVKNAAWVKNPIDRFVLARLEAEGLTPAPEADKRTLIRRVTLDLTGLPPEPADVEAFVADTHPDAYERLVDRLLQSPRWGEHRARYWLDYARYADTHGIHFDNYREMWSYRDWVISAFNRNLPFDQFTIEQLAGDLLPKPTLDQRIATGFTRCNITTNEGGAINEEYYVLYARDRTETATQIWMGSTAGCAVCHDHKFDPLSQKEFYSLSAFFNNTRQNAMDGNIKDTPPILFVPNEADRPRFDALAPQIADARRAVNDRKASARADFDKWFANATAAPIVATIPTEGLRFFAALSEGTGKTLRAVVDGQRTETAFTTDPGWDKGQVADKAFVRKNRTSASFAGAGDFEKDQPFSASVWIKLAPDSGGAVIARMDEASDYRGWDLWVENGRIGSHIISKWPGDAIKAISREALKTNVWQHVCMVYDGKQKGSSIKVYIDGIEKPTEITADTLKNSIRTKSPFQIGQRSGGGGVDNSAVQDVRLYQRALSGAEIANLASATRASYLIGRGAASLSGVEKDELFAWWLGGADPTYGALSGKLAALLSEENTLRMRGTIAHVASEKDEPPVAYVLFRGDYDKRRDKVSPGTPAALPPMPFSLPKNRLGFAQWLLRPENPLTARVTVNRMWQELFGQGLVRTAGDFGITGELPSHPELLDWLALEFRNPSDGGKRWDIKRFYKMLVMSASYRQSALVTPEKRRKDVSNRLLSRGPRFRMDAEMVRDYALATSGLMSPKIGGASVRPYQPDGVWEAVAMPGSNTRDYRRDSGESLYRRSLYTFWKRAAPPASMDIFNAPAREVCTVRRERTNTPLQALVTLNDVQFVEAARHLAERALRLKNTKSPTATVSDSQRLDFIAHRLLSRPLRPEEARIVELGLDELKAHYATRSAEAKSLVAVGESKPARDVSPETLAAWTMLVNQLLNLDEVLSK